MVKNKDRVFTVRLPEEIYDKLKSEAQDNDLTISWYIRRLVNKELDRLAKQTEKDIKDIQNKNEQSN